MGTCGVAIAVVAAGAVWFTRGAIPSPRHEVAMTTPDRPAGPRLTMRYASFRVVETQAIDATPPALPSVVVEIDDERLLRELREMGRPTGLIRTRGDVVLTADIGLTPVASEKTPGQG